MTRYTTASICIGLVALFMMIGATVVFRPAFADGDTETSTPAAAHGAFATPDALLENENVPVPVYQDMAPGDDFQKRVFQGEKVVVPEGFSKAQPRLFKHLEDVAEAPEARTAIIEKGLPGPEDLHVHRWDISVKEAAASPKGNPRIQVKVHPDVTSIYGAVTFVQLWYVETWELKDGQLRFVSGHPSERSTGFIFGD